MSAIQQCAVSGTVRQPSLVAAELAPSQEYRPAIDGLRALAVLSVFIYHLKPNLLPGGFVGVDIFFVISGFLITSIIFRQCQNDRFSLLQFYQRRIARIFPAFFTVACATMVGACFVFSSQDLASTGANLVASSLSVANIKFLSQGDYFAISPDSQPFLHCWSLSVEEQFYMVFPLFLLLLYRRSPKLVLPVLCLILFLSLVGCVVLTRARPSWAFFLLPTRAWELLAGAILAVRSDSLRFRSDCLSKWLSAAGLIVVFVSFFVVTEGRSFPGYQAILPVIGAICILLPTTGPGSVGEYVLSLSPAVFIGRISYSLYLWHWPIFSLVDYHFYAAPQALRIAIKVGLSFAVAYASYVAIETPLRKKLNLRQNRVFAFALVTALVLLTVSWGIGIRKDNYVNAEISDVARGGLVFNKHGKNGSVMLMGDSHGSMYGKLIKEICEEKDLKLTVISVAAGNPLPSTKGDTRELWGKSLGIVEETKPDVLIFVCAWASKLRNDKMELDMAVTNLQPHVRSMVLLTQPPILPENLSRASIRDGMRPSFVEDSEVARLRTEANACVKAKRGTNLLVIDIAGRFSTGTGEIRFCDEKGRFFYHDSTHVSGLGAELVKPEIVSVIEAAGLPKKASAGVRSEAL